MSFIRKQLRIGGGRISDVEKNTLASVASRFLILHAKPEFNLHLASWRVVFRTPAYNYKYTYHIYFGQ
jgi:hypothetical protein